MVINIYNNLFYNKYLLIFIKYLFYLTIFYNILLNELKIYYYNILF